MSENGFLAPERLEEYWNVVGAIAKHGGVGVTTNKHAFFRRLRELLFNAIPDFDLCRSAFVLRTRTFHDNGWPRRDHELNNKFLPPDAIAAAAVDIRARLDGDADYHLHQVRPAVHGMAVDVARFVPTWR